MLQMNNGKIGGENEDDIQVPISSNERKLTAIRKLKGIRPKRTEFYFIQLFLLAVN